MKKVLIVVESAAGGPEEALSGRTPLQTARCPTAAKLAAAGRSGRLLLPDNEPLRSEVALAVLLGVPEERAARLRRGPVEARGAAADALEYAFAYRGELVTVDGDRLRDARLGRMSLEETALIAGVLQEAWKGEGVDFFVAAPAVLSVLLRTAPAAAPEGEPPDLAEGEALRSRFSRGAAGGFPAVALERSREALAALAVNEVRIDLGENPANALWLWGGGDLAAVRAVGEAAPGGCLVGADPLATGMAALLGMTLVPLGDPWKSGTPGPCFRTAPLVEAVRTHDLVAARLPAPFRFGSFGGPGEKVRALEIMDERFLAPFVSVLEAHGPARFLLAAEPPEYPARAFCPERCLPFLLTGAGVPASGESGAWDETADGDSAVARALADVWNLLEEC